MLQKIELQIFILLSKIKINDDKQFQTSFTLTMLSKICVYDPSKSFKISIQDT